MDRINLWFESAARIDRAGMALTRIRLMVVLTWIGGLKGMSFVTLSFLVTTSECWVQPLGSPEHGFPLLSGAGRLIIKDAIMMGAAVVTMADSAKAYLQGNVKTTSGREAGP